MAGSAIAFFRGVMNPNQGIRRVTRGERSQRKVSRIRGSKQWNLKLCERLLVQVRTEVADGIMDENHIRRRMKSNFKVKFQ